MSCKDGDYYYGDRCIKTCPDTHYADGQLRECLPCSSNCRACTERASNCKTCRPKLVLDANNRCVAQCNGTSAGGSNDCLQCRSPCLTCFDQTEKSCLSCEKGYRLIGSECIRDQRCPDGFYLQKSELDGSECRRCHASCKRCKGSSHANCTECSDSTMLHDGLCQPCQEGQFLNSAVKACEVCHSSCVTCSGPTR